MLATNGRGETFAIFLYADGLIQWTTGDADGGTNGLGGNAAQIGVNSGDGESAVIGISGTSDVLNVASTSNIGENGVYVLKISDVTIPVVTSK